MNRSIDEPTDNDTTNIELTTFKQTHADHLYYTLNYIPPMHIIQALSTDEDFMEQLNLIAVVYNNRELEDWIQQKYPTKRVRINDYLYGDRHQSSYRDVDTEDSLIGYIAVSTFGLKTLQCHSPTEIDERGRTVAHLLALSGEEIPTIWEHDPLLRNPSTGQTVAMILLSNGIIPQPQWHHSSTIRDNNGNTPAMLLASCTPLYSFVHDETTNKFTITYPSNSIQSNNKLKLTISNGSITNLTPATSPLHGAITQPFLLHSPHLTNDKDGNTVAMLLMKKEMPPPTEWLHDASLQNAESETVAIIAANRGTLCGNEWNHNPLIRDHHGNTVAMYLAYNGIIPEDPWLHQSNIYNNDLWTVEMILSIKHGYICGKFKPIDSVPQLTIQIPPHWLHSATIRDINDSTPAMTIAQTGINPPPIWYHDPALQGTPHKRTVAMIISQTNKNIPPVWYHDPTIQDASGDTVAHLLARNRIIPGEHWAHDPLLKNNEGKTVAMYLADSKHKQSLYTSIWMHNVNVADNNGETLDTKLDKIYVEYVNGTVPSIDLNLFRLLFTHPEN
jgi:hypothetical protein